MPLLRLFLLADLLALVSYTAFTIVHHGINLLPQFFGDMAAMVWPGQFNLDFTCFLALLALWVSWRHQFTPGGLALGVLAFFGGMLFLSVYLLVQTGKRGTNPKVLLLGEGRA
ncbi:hypothetical protein [Novosphingobium sp.]|uniref:hypothetical protein n=1 Tax=Novosphingobium sp. TaxID=1874826 RepID=UPI002869FC63|nr:hypothetical protein [Novosphingobium sp.]